MKNKTQLLLTLGIIIGAVFFILGLAQAIYLDYLNMQVQLAQFGFYEYTRWILTIGQRIEQVVCCIISSIGVFVAGCSIFSIAEGKGKL